MSDIPNLAEVQALLQADDIEDKEAVSNGDENLASTNPIPGPQLPVFIPADIYIKGVANSPFLCWETGSWAYTNSGIHATGRWETDEEGIERDLLFPYEQLAFIEFHYEVLAKTQEALDEQETEDVEPS